MAPKRRPIPHTIRASTVARRAALRDACISRMATNLDLDLDHVYPKRQRRFPPDFQGDLVPHEPYQTFQEVCTGLGIDLSALSTCQQPPADAAAPMNRSLMEKKMKQIAKLIFFMTGGVDSITTHTKALNISGNQQGMESATYDVKKVKNELRRDLIVKRMKPICLAFVKDNDFIDATLNLDTFADRSVYWTQKLDETPALLFWFWLPLGSVVNLKFVLQEGEPATSEGRKAKIGQLEYFRIAFIHILDWVFRFTVDQDISEDSLDRFDEWDAEVTKKLKTLKDEDAIKDCMLKIGEWPSYASVQNNRQWRLSDFDNDDNEDEDPFEAFRDD